MNSADDPSLPRQPGPQDAPAGSLGPMANQPEDPLPRILDGLEASVETPWSSLDATCEDPISQALGQLELSVDNVSSRELSPEYWELFHLAKGSSGDATQEQAGEPTPGQLSPGGSPVERGEGDFRRPSDGRFSHAVSPTRKQEQPSREQRAPRQHPEPYYHMMGHGAGIRNTGPTARRSCDAGLDQYCQKHLRWVLARKCPLCPDFEREEQSSSGQDNDHCRHAYFDKPMDWGKTTDDSANSDDQDDRES